MASFYYISKEKDEKHYTLKECTDDGSTFTWTTFNNVKVARTYSREHDVMIFENTKGHVGVMKDSKRFLEAMKSLGTQPAMKHAKPEAEKKHRYIIRTAHYVLTKEENDTNPLPSKLGYFKRAKNLSLFSMTETDMKALITELRTVQAQDLDEVE